MRTAGVLETQSRKSIRDAPTGAGVNASVYDRMGREGFEFVPSIQGRMSADMIPRLRSG